ncbi:hypothetical protein [Halodesulfovibrio marinisediminis]|uniref:Uncharacterized protein n=1 Tax=Halodesulfovibrio marinisediminis DSM 17456 TaxID=1121457 RepID=A0A1N6H7M2_9BACT|nr:hypothetical protein [Halodesulfovibrio marinisediminis]SIO15818.1 hypothetical protein SAMN02745161_2056 [Halodesulfovibrio marinisediminis DSM 17456]
MKLVRVLMVAIAITCIASSSVFAMQQDMMMAQPIMTEGMAIMKVSSNCSMEPIRMKAGQMMSMKMDNCLKMKGLCMPMMVMQGCMMKMPMIMEDGKLMPMVRTISDQYVVDGMLMECLMMPVVLDNCMIAMVPVMMKNGLLYPMMMKKGMLTPMRKPIMMNNRCSKR